MEFLVQSVLAVLALVITFFQFMGEIRARKEDDIERDKQKQEKDLIRIIVKNLDKARSSVDSIRDFKRKIDEISKKTNNNPSDVFPYINESLDNYEESFNEARKTCLNDIYEWLVANEEKFPMAHGYGRYINDFRIILNFENIKRARYERGYDKAYMKAYSIVKNSSGNLKTEDKLVLDNLVSEIMIAIEPYFDHADLMDVVITELSIKYGRDKI